MKKTIKVPLVRMIGIIAMVAIIGFGFVACDNGGGGGGGAKTFTSIDDVSDYLDSASGGDSADKPIKLKVKIDLGDGDEEDSGWQELLDALDTAGKFVDLDLSGCTGTEFNTGVKWDDDNSAYVQLDGMDKIVSLTLPNGITSIDNYAFYDCTGLTSVTIPDSVTTIGSSAFSSCTGLTSLTIGSGVTSIGFSAFDECTGLESVTFQTGSNITSANFNANYPFLGDLRAKYLATGGAGGAGTYTTTAPVSSTSVWTKQ